MRPNRKLLLQTWTLAVVLSGTVTELAYSFSTFQPFNGCTTYKPRLVPSFNGCAEFTAVRGRHGCKKTKGICPACVVYLGDDLQMWLPDYFIEVTKHAGQSVFAQSADSSVLAAQLAIGVKWWEISTASKVVPVLSNGSQSFSGAGSFWHARILTVPYGAEANTYPPLQTSKGSGLPVCFSAVSEFLPAQWNQNLADGPFAAAWAPVGAPMCLSVVGGGVVAGAAEAKRQVSAVSGSLSGFPSTGADGSCANPVGVNEALGKDALPSADTVAPVTDLTKLCMGSWGNLVPRTGWVGSDDPYMSALIAAYKFQSLAGDMHMNQELKLKDDDKWQIVYPPRASNACFHPGSPDPVSGAGFGGEDPAMRAKDEIGFANIRKAQTYVIAVWRRRNSCEEPLQAVGGWSAAYKVNFTKNQAICQGVGSL